MSLQRKLTRKTKSAKLDKAVNEAWLLLQQGRYPEAESTARRILARQPNNGRAHQLLGLIALNKGHFQRAISSFTTAASSLPTSPEIHCDLGIAYREAGLLDDSRKTLLKALQLNPHLFETRYNLGLLELRSGRIKDAIQHLRQALVLNPERLPLVTLIADTCIRAKDFRSAIEVYEQYFAFRKSAATASNEAAGEKENPIPELLSGPTILPSIPSREEITALTQLSNLYLRSGHPEKACQSARQALRLDSGNLKGNLVLATIARQKGNLEEAAQRLKQLDSISGQENDLAAVLTELGRAYDLMGKYEEAFAAFSRANRIMADLPSTEAIDRTSMPSLVRQCTYYCTRKKAASAASPRIADALPTPFFLVGFPRSGTTLTERIIRAQLEMQTSDELPILHEMTYHLPRILNRPFSYPSDLDSLGPGEILHLRKHYWEKVTTMLDYSIGVQCATILAYAR